MGLGPFSPSGVLCGCALLPGDPLPHMDGGLAYFVFLPLLPFSMCLFSLCPQMYALLSARLDRMRTVGQHRGVTIPE